MFPSDFPDKIFNNLRAIQPFCLCEKMSGVHVPEHDENTLKNYEWINFSVSHSVSNINI